MPIADPDHSDLPEGPAPERRPPAGLVGLEVLACPRCRGGLRFDDGEARVVCVRCGAAYAVVDGVIDFIGSAGG